MRLVEIIEDVKGFWIDKEQLYLAKNNSLKSKIFEVEELMAFDLKFSNEKVFIKSYDEDGFEKTLVYDISKDRVINSYNRILLSIYQDKLGVFSSYDIEYNSFIEVWDLEMNFEKWKVKTEDYFHDIIEGGLVFSNQNFISKREIDSGNIEWQFDLKESFSEVDRIFGPGKDNIYIGFKNEILIKLDSKRGDFIWKSEDKIPISNLRISNDQSKLYVLQLNKYVELNSVSGEFLVDKDLEHYLADYFGYSLFYIRTSKYDNGLIYFVGGRKGFSDTLGVFDTKTQQIIWHHKLDIPQGEFIGVGDDKLQFTEDKIYVLDTSNQLHVFQKENV